MSLDCLSSNDDELPIPLPSSGAGGFRIPAHSKGVLERLANPAPGYYHSWIVQAPLNENGSTFVKQSDNKPLPIELGHLTTSSSW